MFKSLLFSDPNRSEIESLTKQLFNSITITDIDQFRSAYSSLKGIPVDITQLRYESRDGRKNLQEHFEWHHQLQQKRRKSTPGNPIYDQMTDAESIRVNAFNNEVSPIIGQEFEAAKNKSHLKFRCCVS